MKHDVINILRDRYGLSQKEIADCLDMERSHVNMIVNGKRSSPSKAMSVIPLIFPIRTEEGFKALEQECREKRPLPLLDDEQYEIECRELCIEYNRELEQLDMYHAQYAALKPVYDNLLITDPDSTWRYKIEGRLKKISKHLGPQREVARLALEFFKKEKKRMEEKRERDKVGKA